MISFEMYLYLTSRDSLSFIPIFFFFIGFYRVGLSRPRPRHQPHPAADQRGLHLRQPRPQVRKRASSGSRPNVEFVVRSSPPVRPLRVTLASWSLRRVLKAQSDHRSRHEGETGSPKKRR